MKLATNGLGAALIISFISGIWISLLSLIFGYDWLGPLKIAAASIIAWIVLVLLTFLFDAIEEYTGGSK